MTAILPQLCNRALPRLRLQHLGAPVSMLILQCRRIGMTENAKGHMNQ